MKAPSRDMPWALGFQSHGYLLALALRVCAASPRREENKAQRGSSALPKGARQAREDQDQILSQCSSHDPRLSFGSQRRFLWLGSNPWVCFHVCLLPWASPVPGCHVLVSAPSQDRSMPHTLEGGQRNEQTRFSRFHFLT